MASHSLPLAFFLLVTVSILAADAIPWDNLIHRWPPVKDVDSPKIQALAKFTVSQHNEDTGESLVYVKVLGGRSQPQRLQFGRDYKLLIEAVDANNIDNTYEAIVWDNPQKHSMKLVSFEYKS